MWFSGEMWWQWLGVPGDVEEVGGGEGFPDLTQSTPTVPRCSTNNHIENEVAVLQM